MYEILKQYGTGLSLCQIKYYELSYLINFFIFSTDRKRIYKNYFLFSRTALKTAMETRAA